MDDMQFDFALIGAAFDLSARLGWSRVSVAAAAREAGLPLDEARSRFPFRSSILLALGRMADRAALSAAEEDGSERERLFEILMRRFDTFQPYRAGVLAALRALPSHPGEALLLALATRTSMGWMLEGAGISTAGLMGEARIAGLSAVWAYAWRTWQNDGTEDLSRTMAALDRALDRAHRVAGWLGAVPAETGPKPFPEMPVPPAHPPMPPEGMEGAATSE